MKLTREILVLAALLLSMSGIVSAQVPTGTPPFGSFGGGPVDTIDLANLNVHFSIPTLSKAGRGLSFTYPLSYDTSIWYSSSTLGSLAWTPGSNYGWVGTSPTPAGFNTNNVTTTTQNCNVGGGHFLRGTIFTYTNWAYHDGRNTAHPFIGTAVSQPSYCGPFIGFTNTSNDGAGHTINVQSGFILPVAPVVARRGTGILPSITGDITDTNGNEITANSSGVITDTLGNTLTIAGTGTPSSPVTLTYIAPSGGNAVYTIKYAAYTVRTNFGCSGIAEYAPTAQQDLVSEIDLPDQSVVSTDKYTFTYEATPGFSGDITGRLASFTLPTGGTISYTYSGGSNGIECADGSAAGLTRVTPDGTWTYSRSLGSGGASTTTITDPQDNQTVINFIGIYPTETQVYQGSASSGTLLKTTYTCYNGVTSPCNSTGITLPITEKSAIVQWPGGLESETNGFYNSTHGTITEVDEYAYGSGAPGALVRKTLTTYASLTNGIVDKPASVTVEDGSGNIKSQTTYCYDEGTPSGTTTCNAAGSPTATSGTPQHVSITGSRGNVTTAAVLVSGTTVLAKTFTYYDTGNLNVGTDVNGAQTIYNYGSGSCGNSFPTSISEPLGLSQSTVWNCTGAVVTGSQDENGFTTSTSYTDPYYWRPASTTDPVGNIVNNSYSGVASVESSMVFNSSASTSDNLSTADSLGRKHVSQKKQSPSSSTYDSIEVDYDSNGRPSRTTLAYSGTARQTNSSAPSTTTSYDALNRRTQVSDSGGRTATLAYTKNDVYVSSGPAPTGENAKRKQYEYDALGRLTSVCEITSGTGSGTCSQTSAQTGYWTEYTYNANNKVTGVAQNAQSLTTQTRSYTYDDLGRMTSETNPEAGTTSYTYDTDATCGTSKGDLVKKVDAIGNTTCFTYDALHRTLSMTYPSGSYATVTPNRYFLYDSASVSGITMVNAKARMAEAYTCFSPCSTKLTDIGFSYTARGENSDVYESTPHSGVYNHVSQSYWANGALHQLSGLSTMPSITYNLDGEGRIYSASASSGQNPLASTIYNFATLPTTVNLGSSDGDSFTYDSNTNRMTQYEFTVNGQSVVGNLTWNAIGTLETLSITDPFNSGNVQSCTYAHDDLQRIASYNCGSLWSQSFSYDPFGNLEKTGSMSFSPTYSTSTNRMTLIGSSVPTYDGDGNVTNDFLHTYSWDSNGRPVTIDAVGATYDALGRMVEQNRSGSYTIIAYNPSGSKMALLTSSGLQKGFVPLTGGSVAVYNSSGLAYYRHSDWLKSSRFASTPSRTMYFDGAYAPFGEPYAGIGTTDLSFTGMNQDTSPNLYDFPAREYGIQGRWPSPDPSGLDSVRFKDPQTLNRYAYGRNSPANVFDSSGLATAPAGGTGVTIDLYIPTAQVPGGNSLMYGLGDNRDADPDGGTYREEIQITFTPSANPSVWVQVVAGESQAVLNVPELPNPIDGTPTTGSLLFSNYGTVGELPGSGGTVQTQMNEDGSVTVQVNTSAFNGFADYPGPQPTDPIYSSLTATMYPDGTGVINGGTWSGYPALEGWSFQNGVPTLLENLPAGNISQLGTNGTPIPPSGSPASFGSPPSDEIDSPIDGGGGGGGDGEFRDDEDPSGDAGEEEDAIFLPDAPAILRSQPTCWIPESMRTS